MPAGADVNDKDEYRRTALLYAGSIGQTETVSLLIAAGADVNPKDKNSHTPSITAYKNDHADKCSDLKNINKAKLLLNNLEHLELLIELENLINNQFSKKILNIYIYFQNLIKIALIFKQSFVLIF